MNNPNTSFSSEEKIRYARQIILPQLGIDGQMRLKHARVLLIGAGGLGSSPAIYLAAAGVGTLGIADDDNVSLSNLHRQILHDTQDIDKPKVLSAKEKLQKINPHVTVVAHQMRLTASNAIDLFKDHDLIIDGTDNLPSRYLINDACFFLKKHFIFSGVHQFEGQISLFGPTGPCYRCIFREPPPPDEMPSCAEAGVIGVVPGILGLMQANEAVKWIAGIGKSLVGRLLVFDALAVRWHELKIQKDPDCPLCGQQPTIKTIQEYSWHCEAKSDEISVQDVKRLRDQTPELYLLDVREQSEWDMARIEGARHKPLSSLEKNFKDIPKDRPVYCFCKVGGRSRKAIEFLRQQGYDQLFNIKGGITAWSKEIDPNIPQL